MRLWLVPAFLPDRVQENWRGFDRPMMGFMSKMEDAGPAEAG